MPGTCPPVYIYTQIYMYSVRWRLHSTHSPRKKQKSAGNGAVLCSKPCGEGPRLSVDGQSRDVWTEGKSLKRDQGKGRKKTHRVRRTTKVKERARKAGVLGFPAQRAEGTRPHPSFNPSAVPFTPSCSIHPGLSLAAGTNPAPQPAPPATAALCSGEGFPHSIGKGGET